MVESPHYRDVIMGAMAYQNTSLAIVFSTVYSGADQRKHQSSASLAFVWGIHRWPVNSPHKGPITQKLFLFDDVIMSMIEWWAAQLVKCWLMLNFDNPFEVEVWNRHIVKTLEVLASSHDDVIKWKHFPRNWPFVRGIYRSRWIPRTKGQWRGALMSYLICVCINDWVNNREAGDLRRHRGH